MELQDLSRAELNGQRGLCLGALLGCKGQKEEKKRGSKAQLLEPSQAFLSRRNEASCNS